MFGFGLCCKKLAEIQKTLFQVLDLVQNIHRQEARLMPTIADIQKAIEDATAEVATQKTVIDSNTTLLGKLTGMIASVQGQLQTALASADPTAIQNAMNSLNALKTGIQDATDSLSQAVVANTPAE